MHETCLNWAGNSLYQRANANHNIKRLTLMQCFNEEKKRWLIENRTTGRRVQRLGICSFLFVWKNNSCVFRVYSVWQKKKKTQHNESKRTQICSAWYTALIMNRVRNSSWSRIAFAFTFPFSFDVHFTSVKLYFPSSMRCFCRNFGMVFFCMV